MKPTKLQKFQEITLSLFSRSSLGELAESTRDIAKRFFNIEHCAVFFIKEKYGELEGLRPGDDDMISFPVGQGLAGLVAEEGQCLIIENVSESPVYIEEIDGVAGVTPEDILSAPIRTATGEISGVIQLINKIKGGFSGEDEDLIAFFGRRVGVAFKICRKLEEWSGFSKNIFESVASAVDAKFSVTLGQSARVRDNALKVADALGVDHEHRRIIEYAALLYNIGRLAYNTDIKELGYEEEKGRKLLFTEAIMRQIEFPGSLQDVYTTVMHVEEKIDGSGRPQGLAGENIPLGSRIIAVCDAFDTLFVRGRNGKKYSEEEVIEYLKQHAGSQFDSEVVDIFISTKIYKHERRRHQRIDYSDKIEVTRYEKDGTEGKSFTTDLMDLSSGGLLFFSTEKIEPNSMLKVKIYLAVGVIEGIVRTARIFENSEKDGYNIGAYFIWNSSGAL